MNDEAADEQPTIRIGEELARAAEAERRRLASAAHDASPMPAERYDAWDEGLGIHDPAPLPPDAALAGLARRFSAATPAERERMRRAIPMDALYELIAFARRAAVFALRERSAARVRDALAAVAMIERERVDFRDVLVALALVHHSARRIGEDADAMFREAAALAERGTAELLEGFAARSEEEKDLRTKWGYVEVDTPHGPGFLQWEFGRYDPTLDLSAAALEIGALLRGDGYATNVVLATRLWPVWLRAEGDQGVDRALRSIRACATVNAWAPRPADAPDGDRMLFATLAETADDGAARALRDAVRRVRADDHAVLGVAEGPLFLMLVSPPVARGMTPPETMESLARFEAGLSAILARHAAHGGNGEAPPEDVR